jgi:2-aminoadipate transaminase
VKEAQFSMDYDTLISESRKHVHASDIHYLNASDKFLISFHLGIPDPATFPITDVERATKTMLREKGKESLQYGEVRGDPSLREDIVSMYRNKNVEIQAGNVLITYGISEALDLVSQLFIEPKDVVVTEYPTYLWAIRSFRFCAARIIGVPMDDGGIRTDLVDETLRGLKRKGKRAKFVYVIPDFHNPTGVCLTLKRRKELLRVAEKHSTPILEDGAYTSLRFEGDNIPSLFSLDDNNLVLNAGTFSKTISAGLRLGWIVGPEEIINKLSQLKATGTSLFVSKIVSTYIRSRLFEPHVKKIVTFYRGKRDAMLTTLKTLSTRFSWTTPMGGFYVWLKLPKEISEDEFTSRALNRGIIVLQGSRFCPDGKDSNQIRLSYSFESIENIKKGIGSLAEI